MNSHPDTTLCVHNGINWNEPLDRQYCLINELDSGYLTYEESICFTKGHFPTCSFFFKTNMLNFPSVSKNAPPVADDPIMYYSVNNGQVYYMDKVWAIRTYMHPGSWNVSVETDKTKKLAHCVRYVDYLKDFHVTCDKKLKPYIMAVMMGLLSYGIRYFICSEKYSFEELSKGTESIREESMHHYDDLCYKCMVEMTKLCVDYPQLLDRVLSHFDSKIYIYGAGEEAAKLYEIIDKLGYAVEAFIITKKTNEKEYMLHKIITIDDFEIDNPQLTVLLGLGWQNSDEVIGLLKEKKAKNRIIYNGHNIQL